MADLGGAGDGEPTSESSFRSPVPPGADAGPAGTAPTGIRARSSAASSGRRGKRVVAVVLALALAVLGGSQLAGHGQRKALTGSGPHVASTRTGAASPLSPTPPATAPALRPRPGVVLTAPSSSPPAPTSAAVTVDPAVLAARTAAVESVLARRAAALLHRDAAGWEGTVAPSAAGYGKSERAVFTNTALVPFASYYYEVDRADVAAATSPRTGELLIAVTLRYALRGFDPQPTALRQYLTFRTDDWRLVSDADGSAGGLTSAHDLWDFGPVVVVRGQRSLVLAHPGRAGLAAVLATTADGAVPRVTAFWGTGWARKVVILVPDSQDELRKIVGTRQDLSQIAALATAEIGATPGAGGAVGDRIAINPRTFATLGTLGRRVVITHEITHVASRSVTGAGTPTWLVEGLADYVGFKGTTTSTRFDAGELARQVDRGHLPTRLPSSTDFARAGSNLPLDYEQAWLACRFIVSRTDEATLIAFYRQVGTATGSPAQVLKAAFAQVLHTDEATFTRSWSSYVGASLR